MFSQRDRRVRRNNPLQKRAEVGSAICCTKMLRSPAKRGRNKVCGYELGGNFEQAKLDQSLSKLHGLGFKSFLWSRGNFSDIACNF